MQIKVIPSDITITSKLVTELITEQFDLDVKKINFLGEGWDNAVYLVNDHIVFRFPRRKESVALIETEINILPTLKKHLSIAIPDPVYIGQPTRRFKRPFYGHEIVSGASGSSVMLTHEQYEQAAHDLGIFLKRLHHLDPKQIGISSFIADTFNNRSNFTISMEKFSQRLETINPHYPLDSVNPKIKEICSNASLYSRKAKKALVHGDLYNRHLIFCQKNQLVGVIDWGDCALADPVADLGIVFQFLPKAVHETFFKTYGHVDEKTLNYARFIGLYYAVTLLWFGHDRKDKDLIRTSLATLMEI